MDADYYPKTERVDQATQDLDPASTHGGASAWLHQPDGTVRRVAGFDGHTIKGVTVREGDIPLLYGIRPVKGHGR